MAMAISRTKSRKIYKTCQRCKMQFADAAMRVCPNPAVRQAFGDGHICYYCCKRCKYHTKHPLCGAIGCGYKGDDKP